MQAVFPVQHKFLQLLGEEEISRLSALMDFRFAQKNEVLIPVGKPVKDVFYIKKGIVRSFLPDESGREINIHLAWEGMFVTSFYSRINNRHSDESVVAITPCELYHFTYDGLASLFDPYPKVERLARLLAEEAFSCLGDRVRFLQTLSAKERYLQLMGTIPAHIFLNIPLQELASYLGIAPGSLSRIRNEFLHIR